MALLEMPAVLEVLAQRMIHRAHQVDEGASGVKPELSPQRVRMRSKLPRGA